MNLLLVQISLLLGIIMVRVHLIYLLGEDAKSSDFKIRTIADISCDIDGPVASTIRPSTIANQFMVITLIRIKKIFLIKMMLFFVMAVDNLPCELPKDASEDFGNALIQHVFTCLLSDTEQIIARATIVRMVI